MSRPRRPQPRHLLQAPLRLLAVQTEREAAEYRPSDTFLVINCHLQQTQNKL